MRIELPQADGTRVVYLPNESRFRLRKHRAGNCWCIEAILPNSKYQKVRLLMYNTLEGLDGEASLDILLRIVGSITETQKVEKGWYENVE